MTKSIRKAIFPVAGLGTRFLPATKAMPKEMLTVVDRPLIQHVVDEAREAGIEHFVFITGRNKGVIEDHFDKPFELEQVLREREKHREIALLDSLLPGPGQTSFIRQQEPMGLGHAVWCARDLAAREPFALLLPDVLVHAPGQSCLSQMIAQYDALVKELGPDAKINLVAVEEVPADQTHQYGVVSLGEGREGLWPVTGMVEKPKQGTAPSNLIIMGRYILQPEIFDILTGQSRGAGGEIQITDAMRTLMETQRFFAYQYEGRSYDCGSKLGFLVANVVFALQNKELAGPFTDELQSIMGGLLKGK